MNDEPFDSTHLRNKSFEFKLGANEVVLGLDIAVATMKKHEKSQVSKFILRINNK